MASNFFINNGKRLADLLINEGSAINSNDKFLSKYDKNNNSIWDADEISAFLKDMENADVNGDGVLDADESIAWYSKITNLAIDKVKVMFANEEENDVYNSLSNIMSDYAQSEAIKWIDHDAMQGLNIYYAAIGGPVSKAYNSIKELFKTEYSGDKVYRQLVSKQVSAELLKSAKSNDGLTSKEYVQTKINLLNYLLGAEKLSSKEQEQINKSIMQMDFKTLDSLILKLTNSENDEFPDLQKDAVKNMLANTKQDEIGFNFLGANTVGGYLNSAHSEEKMSFEEIYQLEMGVPFNQDNSIQKHAEQYLLTNSIIGVYNKVTEITEDLNKDIAAIETKNTTNGDNVLYNKLSTTVIKALQNVYGKDSSRIEEFLSHYGAKIEDNELSQTITFNNGSSNLDRLVYLSKDLKEILQTNLATLMDGKTIEDYQSELKSAYELAYGARNNVDLASKFQESQAEGVAYAKMAVSTAGLAVAVLSDGTLLPIVGILTATFGSGAVSALEATKDGISKEEAKEIAKELATSGILTAIGMKEGKIAQDLAKLVAKSCPKFVQYVAEYGSMAVMGALTDYAVMGDISLSGETISNLLNIATGIIAHKKMAKIQNKLAEIKSSGIEVVGVADDVREMNSILEKIYKADDIRKIGDEIINSSEFEALHKDYQNIILKAYNGLVDVQNATGKSGQEALKLLKIMQERHFTSDNIALVSKYIDNHPQYENEIFDILFSNKNIQFAMSENGIPISHLDEVIWYIEKYPEHKNDIVDFMKVQRRADNDSTNPAKGIPEYLKTLDEYPKYRDLIIEFSKNGNLDTVSSDGVNSILSALNLHLEGGHAIEDILLLSARNYNLPEMRNTLLLCKKYPELREYLLKEIPNYEFIDKNVTTTDKATIEKRFKIKESLNTEFADDMARLQQTLGDEFFFKVKWEDIIPDGASHKEIKTILHELNEASKFFARTTVNERSYGKNIQWAMFMNNISDGAGVYIRGGASFEEVLNFIAYQYHTYDVSTTLATNNAVQNDRRIASGTTRRWDSREGYMTEFDTVGSYQEYYEKFKAAAGERKSPYDDIELTRIEMYTQTDNVGRMSHPADRYVEPGLEHISDKYNELLPLFEKIKNGGQLTRQEIAQANDCIAEIYFLMANIMPYQRGSNGISDILIRSMYKQLGIEQPALKHGTSLDLEAFCMDLDAYKANWLNFFEKM